MVIFELPWLLHLINILLFKKLLIICHKLLNKYALTKAKNAKVVCTEMPEFNFVNCVWHTTADHIDAFV